jgi:hypothetical protein
LRRQPHRIHKQIESTKDISAAHTVVLVAAAAVVDGGVELLLHHLPAEPGAGAGNSSSGKILSRRGITAAALQ